MQFFHCLKYLKIKILIMVLGLIYMYISIYINICIHIYLKIKVGGKSYLHSLQLLLCSSNVVLNTKLYIPHCMVKSNMENGLFYQEPSVFIFTLTHPKLSDIFLKTTLVNDTTSKSHPSRHVSSGILYQWESIGRTASACPCGGKGNL